MTGAAISHIGFADESHWNHGRFRSIGLVTLPLSALDAHHRELTRRLEASNVREFKWHKLDGAKDRFAAEKLCYFAIEAVRSSSLRVDVLIWDTQDSRHQIVGRDDTANLHRMYYHLFRNVLQKRWPDNATWRLHPDEHNAMEWPTLKAFLEKATEPVSIEEIQPVRSAENPLLMLADLFAGMAVFSRDEFEGFNQWQEAQYRLPSLLEDEKKKEEMRFSGRQRQRFRVLQYFDNECKNRKFGVSLRSECGLRTFNPNLPFNFWLYEPQHPEDKAPTKG